MKKFSITLIALTVTSFLVAVFFGMNFLVLKEHGYSFSSLVLASSLPAGLIFFAFVIERLIDKK